ncbi:MAG TPA: hypothetical protein VE944_15210 [Nostoc sp.]|uniref:hypothetical protein n=1 Tax=Nostoc sp. TaxID=1180 RepID=UPI002D666547|nr:hypothetical protein [Nostoc sp.]HYX15684.1 hypothetical protein [Nostoc sp.]
MSDIPQVTGSLAIRNIDDLSRLSAMLAKSGFFADAKEAAQCGVKVLAGLELGFGPLASMVGVHIINGKPSIGANLMAAAVKRSGKYNYRITRHDNDGCTIVFYENGEVIGESTFTRDDAQAAGALDGKNGHTWKKFPRNMMFNRAMSNGVRWYCPDIFAGSVAYTPEELDCQVDEEGNTVDISIADQQPPLTVVPDVHPQDLRVKQIRTLLDYPLDLVKEWLHFQDAKTPSQLGQSLVDELVKTMCLAWAADKIDHPLHAENSYKKHVTGVLSPEFEELEAIRQWMQHVQQTSPAQIKA